MDSDVWVYTLVVTFNVALKPREISPACRKRRD